MKTIFTIYFLLLLTLLSANSPKREMRGVWITTVVNIDFPSNADLSPQQQRDELSAILDKHEENGINAIFFQVRPSADAFYYSELEPWSKYLNGEQGKAPSPFYDPLTYIIEEAHKRNMELHAWINPFRVRLNKNDKLSKWHIYNLHPEWGWDYGNKTYLDPGIPKVREYVQNIVLDITKRYDIDGVHFDDYFYPYAISGESLPDNNTFKTYGDDFYPNSIEDWRRDNINTFIKEINVAIKKEKAWVKFGVSPFGIWKNSETKDDKLPTKFGSSSYDILYADVITWLKEGWVDYCAPQLYWSIGDRNFDYEKLLKWWDTQSYGRNMYVGHSLYKVSQKSEKLAWRDTKEIERQITMSRDTKNVSGSILYSSNHLTGRKEMEPLCEALKSDYYKEYALPPLMPWIDNISPLSPRSISNKETKSGHSISWKAPRFKDDMNKAERYVVYNIKVRKGRYKLKAEDIVCITRNTEIKLEKSTTAGYYAVTALDRMNNESKPTYIHIRAHKKGSVVFNIEENMMEMNQYTHLVQTK